MTITALPTPPSRANPTTFSSDADAFLGALPDFATEANALADDVSAKQTTASSAATTATTQAGIATAKAAEAEASANTAANTAGASAWVSGNTYSTGDCVYSALDFQTYRRKTNGSGTTDPSLDSTNWTPLTGAIPTASQAEMEAGTEAGLRAMSPLRVKQAIFSLAPKEIKRSSRVSNNALAASDIGSWIDLNGAFTQTFSPCADLKNGWYCYIGNSGTGDITLDPNGSETIDGLTSYVMYPGEVRLIQCDGSELRSIVLNSFYKVFEASGNFIKPPGYSTFSWCLWAGGGSGRQGAAGSSRVGGGGGAGFHLSSPASALSGSESIVIGAGGEAVTTINTNGSAGGDSTFLGITVYGGKGGTTAQSNGGSARAIGLSYAANQVNGYVDTNGLVGTFGGVSARTVNITEKITIFGGCAGGSIDSTDVVYSSSGVSVFGGNGGVAAVSGVGGNGVAPGGGGATSTNGFNSGAGARGELRIWGVI